MQANLSIVQPLLQRSLDLMETAACWERKAAKKAHMCGYQGEKRRLRYLYREARNVVDWTEHTIYDILKLDMSPQSGTVDVSSMICLRSTMSGIIDKLWTIYNETHQIANELVVAKFKNFAEPLYDYAYKLFNEIVKLQRAATEYEMGDYQYQLISRYQVGMENVHDTYEPKEESQGYKDY